MIRRFLSYILVFIFIAHGAIYYLFPQDLYNEQSPLKLLKYVLVVLFIAINISYIRSKEVFLYIIVLLIGFIFFETSHHPSIGFSAGALKKFILYMFPLLLIIITPIIDRLKLTKMIFIIILIAVIGAFIEYHFLAGLFSRFDFTNRGGFIRVVSIFVSPNNSGLLLALALIYFYERSSKSKFLRVLMLILIILSIYYTGSKTPLLIVFLYIFFKCIYNIFFIRVLNAKVLIAVGCTIIFSILVSIVVSLDLIGIESKTNESKTRSYDSQTAEIRYKQFFDYFDKASTNLIAPDYTEVTLTYDIAYIQFWSDFGILGLISFITIILPVAYYYRIRHFKIEVQFVILILLLCGFSLSIFTIWPTAYIFWYLVLSRRFYRDEAETVPFNSYSS